jgi:condensin complex subunit 1
LVLANLSYILPHLDSEPYNMRSSIVTAVAHILTHLAKQQQQQEQQQQVPNESSLVNNNDVDNDNDDTVEEQSRAPVDVTKSRTALLDLLMDRVYDVSSFTRATVLKALISLTASGSLPKERVLALTKLAMDRLQDKTVMVRKQSMLVRTLLYTFIYVMLFACLIVCW